MQATPKPRKITEKRKAPPSDETVQLRAEIKKAQDRLRVGKYRDDPNTPLMREQLSRIRKLLTFGVELTDADRKFLDAVIKESNLYGKNLPYDEMVNHMISMLPPGLEMWMITISPAQFSKEQKDQYRRYRYQFTEDDKKTFDRVKRKIIIQGDKHKKPKLSASMKKSSSSSSSKSANIFADNVLV